MDLITYCETAQGMLNLKKITQTIARDGLKNCLKLVGIVFGSDDYVANIGK